MEGTTVCFEIPLQPPPPPRDRHLATVYPPPPHLGDRRGLTGEIAGGGGGTQNCQSLAYLVAPKFFQKFNFFVFEAPC